MADLTNVLVIPNASVERSMEIPSMRQVSRDSNDGNPRLIENRPTTNYSSMVTRPKTTPSKEIMASKRRLRGEEVNSDIKECLV